MSEQRRKWTNNGDNIMRILKRHLVDREDISKICEEEKIQSSQFYRWQAQLFEEGAAVFQRKNNSGDRETTSLKTFPKLGLLSKANYTA